MQTGLSFPDDRPKTQLGWGRSVSSTTIHLSNSYAASSWPQPKYEDPTAGMTIDEKRAFLRYLDKLAFEDFIWDRLAELREGRREIRTPFMQKPLRFGTSNGLRPTPMLC